MDAAGLPILEGLCVWVHYFRSRFLSGPSSGSSRSRLEASAASSSESSAPAAEVVLLVEDRWRVEELVRPPFLTFCKKIRVISRTNLVEPKMLLYSTTLLIHKNGPRG